MKKMLSVLILAAMLIASACSVNDVNSEKSDVVMSDLAQGLGITAENYPKIDGSTSTLDIVQRIWREMFKEGGEDIYPEKASKTVPSYKLLIDSEADLIFVPYASQDVLKLAEEKGVELEFTKISGEALIFVTPAENTAQNITAQQVRSIYLDYGIDNWSDLGGPDKELVPLCRNADSGSQSQLDNLILSGEPMHPDIKKNYVELTMEGMLEQTAYYHNGGLDGEPSNSYALGYTLYTYLLATDSVTGIGDKLKILDYEGVTPTFENIADGSYPLTDGYYAVIRSDLPENHPARAIIEWLKSSDGSNFIAKMNLIPAYTAE